MHIVIIVAGVVGILLAAGLLSVWVDERRAANFSRANSMGFDDLD